MHENAGPLSSSLIKVRPLAERRSLSALETILVNPDAEPAPCPVQAATHIEECALRIQRARQSKSTVLLLYGAHLIKNGAMDIVSSLLTGGWVTHLATNGAGTIHDWEQSFQGRTEESVRANVATGTFGTWDETGRATHLALLAGGLREEGYGRSLGRFIVEDGVTFPAPEALEKSLREEPFHPLSPARAELLVAMRTHGLPGGRIEVKHPNKQHSILAQAFNRNVPFTVHPGIGYDIISNHPLFNGGAIGRAAAQDFRTLAGSVAGLDDGVVLSVGSAIMAPQVFEKTLSFANNVRLQQGHKTVQGHSIFVVDIQDGGQWDWSQAEPPKSHPAYYLRFCKTYARMGGDMRYVQCDNVAFLHHLLKRLDKP